MSVNSIAGNRSQEQILDNDSRISTNIKSLNYKTYQVFKKMIIKNYDFVTFLKDHIVLNHKTESGYSLFKCDREFNVLKEMDSSKLEFITSFNGYVFIYHIDSTLLMLDDEINYKKMIAYEPYNRESIPPRYNLEWSYQDTNSLYFGNTSSVYKFNNDNKLDLIATPPIIIKKFLPFNDYFLIADQTSIYKYSSDFKRSEKIVDQMLDFYTFNDKVIVRTKSYPFEADFLNSDSKCIFKFKSCGIEFFTKNLIACGEYLVEMKLSEYTSTSQINIYKECVTDGKYDLSLVRRNEHSLEVGDAVFRNGSLVFFNPGLLFYDFNR
ncbi:MAG: hypothetical protein JHC93_07400 [Parachlamydiales bacterium]|nr:hypothetical protein [Parachlamydiales bacterium]